MERTKKIILLLFVFVFSIGNAQKTELGKVTIEELQQTVHPTDASAPAAILFKKGETYFDYTEEQGFRMTTRVRTKIKIYKKEGYDWANFEQRYYLPNDSRESVSFSDAVTYNLENGKIVKTKLKSEGEFDEKLNKFWGKKKITMPNVKEGSVIEYEYTITSPNYGSLEDWDFQTSIPVNYSEYKTDIPEYFTYNANQRGYVLLKKTVEKQQRSFTISSKERTGFSTSRTTFSQDKIEYESTKTTYVAENLPAMKDEAFVNNIKNYISSISHELSVLKFPGAPMKYLSTDWAMVTKRIYENDDFGAELNKSGYFDDDVNALLAGISAPEQRIAAIFNYVKESVKWNGFYGYSCDDGVRKAYKDKTGNAAEINLMLTAMLRFAGINANPVLISTRSNGIALFPTRTAFNYVISAVEIPNGVVLLDATEKYSLPNILPTRDLNWFGRLIRKDGSSTEVDLMPKSLSKEVTNMMYTLSASGEINGKLRKQFTDQSALYFRQKNAGKNKESYLEVLENENDKIEISDYVRDNENDLSKPVVETYSFRHSNGVDIIGDKIYLNPLLFFNAEVNPFKQEKREYPVDFGYPTEDKYNITIDIPEGYVIETMPAAINLATDNGLGSFKYVIANAGNKIQIVITTDINEAIVGAEYYEVLKDFFQKMIDKQNEKIVLKKA